MREKLKEFFRENAEGPGECTDVKIDEKKIKDIAVIGMAVKMPMADSLEEFWHVISNGISCVRNFPPSRKKDTDDYLKYMGMFNDETVYNEFACLDEIDKFDYQFFNISPSEASLMDPHQRLFMETAWKAIEDSGYGGNRLVGSRTGIYAGHTGQPYYRKFISDIKPSSLPFAITGNTPQMVVSRISYVLNLKGPSMLVDTTCSSSLVAVHLACQAIKNRECEMAIAGGIKINLLPVNQGEGFGIESSDGRTRTFDENSDGTGNGEGAAVVVLKPLYKALEDQDRIYAVVKGSFINQDGSSMGITAPNPEAQEDVIVKAWKNAGIDPNTLSYIEVHGTATKFGDSIEVEGIKRAFKRFNTPYQFCAAGSVKTNLGHLDSAAGIAGLVKCILSLSHGIIPPSIHFNRPNKKIGFEASPIYVNTKARKWISKNGPRRCGVNSLGIGGTNCHMVLEEAPAGMKNGEAPLDNGVLILTLSAQNIDSLKEMVKVYNAVLYEYPGNKAQDICFSACTGRGHYKHRLAVMAGSCEELKIKLDKINTLYFDRFSDMEGVFYGSHKVVDSDRVKLENTDLTIDEKTEMDKAAARIADKFNQAKKMDRLAAQDICSFYVKGADIDWCNMYGADRLEKISLPAYPFRKERCWLELPPDMQAGLNKEHPDFRPVWKQDSMAVDSSMDEDGIENVILLGAENRNFSGVKAQIGQIIGKVLGMKQINIYDNFYRLGGDSIHAMRIINLISKHFGIKVEISELLRLQTIDKFADYFYEEYINRQKAHNIFATIGSAGERESYPLSSAQKRLFIHNQAEDENTDYNWPIILKLKGTVDSSRLESAFKELTDRHEMLRTSYGYMDGEPVQIVHRDIHFKISHIVLEEDNVKKVIVDSIKPYRLEQIPLFRVILIELNSEEHVLLFDMHHINSDGISTDILIREFCHLYNGNKLPPVKIQYKDYACWQNEIMQSEYMKKQEAYWLSKLSTLDYTELPKKSTASPAKKDGAEIKVQIDEGLTRAIDDFCSRYMVTRYVFLLSVFNIILYKETGQENICVGTPVQGRRHSDLENTVGIFLNVLCLSTAVNSAQSFVDYMRSVNADILDAWDNQDYPYEELYSKLSERMKFKSLFSILFNYIPFMDEDILPLNGLTIEKYDFNVSPKYDLTLYIWEGKAELLLDAVYVANYYERFRIQRILDNMVILVRTVLDGANTLIREIGFMQEDQHMLDVTVLDHHFDNEEFL